MIIAGVIRSGTTMLWKLCNQHPEIRLTHEFNQLSFIGQPYAEYVRAFKAHLRIARKRVMGHDSSSFLSRGRSFVVSHIFIKRYFATLRAHAGNDDVDAAVIEASLRSLFPKATIVGDKYPAYILRLEMLTGVEQLRRIVIYRDCRDVVSSILHRIRTDWTKDRVAKTLNTPEKVAIHWVKCIEEMERYADRLYVIRYEDLVVNPDDCLGQLADWLGVDAAGFPRGIVRRNSVGKHGKGLTPEELATVMEIAGPTMARLGYV